MNIPSDIQQILNTLRRAGFEAYLVGGCVRDMLLKREIHDWDITTAALPEQTQSLFARTIPTGIRHGTVTVQVGNHQAEVTTFRTDGDYLDGRHPDRVHFVRSLREDLSRRDFTVNAMAMDADGYVVDMFGGRSDLREGLIRCVGDPEERFREDALRMFRALRFAAQLDFSVFPETMHAIGVLARGSAQLSVERICTELEKTLCSAAPHWVDCMAGLGLLRRFGIAEKADLAWLADTPEVPVVRWAGFGVAYGPDVLPQLRLPRRLMQTAREAAGLALLPAEPMQWVLAFHDLAAAQCYAALTHRETELQQVFGSGVCWNFQMLAVSGSDFPHCTGKETGTLLKKLLCHVLQHPEDNERQTLLVLAEQMQSANDRCE